jgi:hypothetical protein
VKLALLSDIHEDVDRLRVALRRVSAQGVDQVVVLGDVFEMGERVGEFDRGWRVFMPAKPSAGLWPPRRVNQGGGFSGSRPVGACGPGQNERAAKGDGMLIGQALSLASPQKGDGVFAGGAWVASRLRSGALQRGMEITPRGAGRCA